MPTILYSSNSKQLSRFQRKTKINAEQLNTKINTNDAPFISEQNKDSREYLIELCCSVYPTEIHSQIFRCPDWKLPLHAILVLLLKNFVTSWYGEKIVTSDTELLVHLYELVDDVLDDIHNTNILWEQVICDDLPLFVETQVKIMRRVLQEQLLLDDFYQLQLYKHTYPHAIAEIIVERFSSGSRLHNAFLRDFFGDFLLDKLTEKIAEPFIVIDIVKSICESLLREKAENCKLRDRKNWIQKMMHKLWSTFQLSNKEVTTNHVLRRIDQPDSGFFNHYFFSAMNECFQLETRKPLLFLTFKVSQFFGTKIAFVSNIASQIFQNIVTQRVLSGEWLISSSLKVRHLLFPHDNKMGPVKTAPSASEFVIMKKEASTALNQVCRKMYIDKILGIDSNDCDLVIDALAYDRKINQFMIQRLVDYLLTSFPVFSASSNIP